MSEKRRSVMIEARKIDVRIPSGIVLLNGILDLPRDTNGIVLFAHDNGSSRHSKKNQFIAEQFKQANIGTLRFNLLTEEEANDKDRYQLRYNMNLLAKRLVDATRWVMRKKETKNLSIGYLGANIGGGAALIAGAEIGNRIGAIVSRGGRPDLAGISVLERVNSPTLLIVGGHDVALIKMNQEAYYWLKCKKELKIVKGATHLFEEPGALAEVTDLAKDWFARYFIGRRAKNHAA